jgi:hypothetical protein
MVNATPRPLYPQERDPVPILHEAGWATVSVWTGAENLGAIEIRSVDLPTCNKFLYRLSYPTHHKYVYHHENLKI